MIIYLQCVNGCFWKAGRHPSLDLIDRCLASWQFLLQRVWTSFQRRHPNSNLAPFSKQKYGHVLCGQVGNERLLVVERVTWPRHLASPKWTETRCSDTISFFPHRRWSITTTAVCWHRKQQVDVSGLKSCNSICRPCDKSAPTARLLRDKSVGKCDKTIRKIAFLRLGSSTRFEPNLWDHVRQWSTCVDDALSAIRLWVHLLIICSPFSLIDTMNSSLPLPRYTRYTMVTHLRVNLRICWYTLSLKVSSIHFKSVICNEIKFDLRSKREPSQL